MDKTLRSIINRYCHKLGVEHGLALRTKMLSNARSMTKAGKSNDEIISALGIESTWGFKRHNDS